MNDLMSISLLLPKSTPLKKKKGKVFLLQAYRHLPGLENKLRLYSLT